ncbi:hypothetical protein CY34DRAFT_733509 [Suillus luteus UH-Slu-Lm8-n1]|uniref:Uncharacterized protein n=1 Tax=Suillus luteus UH-Slu-Lm8-n1 TaxID=930992 RepID=A0A0D0BR47_9AGAM|nr:hypothetical protein CY34DRAFT_733509 [Suillus luteus UH-Slu-Lm8-n1]
MQTLRNSRLHCKCSFCTSIVTGCGPTPVAHNITLFVHPLFVLEPPSFKTIDSVLSHMLRSTM